MAKLIGWGIFLIIFGLGSLLLPMMGLQFKLFMLFELWLGAFAWVASVVCILAGIALIMIPLMKKEQ